MSFLARPRVKQWGWVILFGMVCFGAGNYHQTEEALEGQSAWYQGWCGKKVRTEVKKAVQKHERDDAQMYGW